MFNNFGLPTKEQWGKIAAAGVFSFISGFLASLVASGGLGTGLDWAALGAALWGALVSGFNMALFTIYTTFFKPSDNGKDKPSK